MKNSQYVRISQYKKGIAPIIIALIVAVILGGGYLVTKGYFTLDKQLVEKVPNPPGTQAIIDELNETANWKTYTNAKYGFSFKYPASLGTAVETSGQIEKLDCNSKTYTEVSLASVGNVGLQIACPVATNENSYKGKREMIIVAGRNSFNFDYTSTTSYHNHEVYIPLNDNLYLSIGSSSKSGQSGFIISPEDFKTMLSTFKFTK